MSGALDRFREAAKELGLHPEVRRFPQGAKTAVDAANAIHSGSVGMERINSIKRWIASSMRPPK